jgi:hypothetical protein
MSSGRIGSSAGCHNACSKHAGRAGRQAGPTDRAGLAGLVGLAGCKYDFQAVLLICCVLQHNWITHNVATVCRAYMEAGRATNGVSMPDNDRALWAEC